MARLFGFLVIAAIAILAPMSVAGATLTGPCEGTGTIEGTTYDPRNLPGVVELPDEADVAYAGSIQAGPGERSHHGFVAVDLPWPLSSWTVADWGTDKTVATSDSGTHHYNAPAVVPRGVEVEVFGEHVDTAGTCAGSARVKLDGGPLDSPAPTAIAGVGTLASLAGVVAAGMAKGGKP